jgi:hypothetical protein
MKPVNPTFDLSACVVAAIWCLVLAQFNALTPASAQPGPPPSSLGGGSSRSVMSTENRGSAIVGSKQTPASDLKQEFPTGARKPAEVPAPNGRDKLAPHAGKTITTVSPRRRAAIAAQIVAIREDQDRLADEVARADARPNPATRPAGTSVWPQAPLGTKVLETSASNKSLGIFAINGRTKNIQLTPGGKVTITGIGLGEPTDVKLTGGGLEHHPVLMRVVSRTPTRIDAEIPSNTRGSPDEAKASLEVRSSSGATYRFDGVSFVAARAEVTVTDPNVMSAYVAFIATDQKWKTAGWSPVGSKRVEAGKSINCRAPGTDHVHFKRRNGFDVVGASMTTGRTDSGDDDENGNAGSRVFTPGYSFGDWVDENITDMFFGPLASDLTVNWGVFRSHTSPHAYVRGTYAPPLYANVDANTTDPLDHCSSDWTFSSLTLYGPAGVAP